MTLRKGKIQRPCTKCGKQFPPSGRFDRICDNCNPKGKWQRKLLKMQKKRIKENKLKKQVSEVPKSKDFRALKDKLEK